MRVDYSSPQGAPFKPGVVTWFNVYALSMAALYLACIAAGILLAIYKPGDTPHDSEMSGIMGWVFGLVSTPLCVGFAMAPMLPRKKWVWIYDIVLIGIGLTSGCTMAASIPLLIFWLKPECKSWFGLDPVPPLPPQPPLANYTNYGQN